MPAELWWYEWVLYGQSSWFVYSTLLVIWIDSHFIIHETITVYEHCPRRCSFTTGTLCLLVPGTGIVYSFYGAFLKSQTSTATQFLFATLWCTHPVTFSYAHASPVWFQRNRFAMSWACIGLTNNWWSILLTVNSCAFHSLTVNSPKPRRDGFYIDNGPTPAEFT